jgi:cysteine desulfurase
MYLDHAAATPVDRRVFDAMVPYFTEKFFNPSSPYLPAVTIRREYEDSKHRIAVAIGVKSDELVMTAGATESINLIFQSVRGHIVTSNIEHQAVLSAASRHGNVAYVESDPKGVVDPAKVAAAISAETELVSIGLANSELGTIQKMRDIASIVKAERIARRERGSMTPIYLHTDASQGAGQIDITVSRLGVDAMTLNAAKMYGPKQVGLLWVSRDIRLEPLIQGGGQERGLRSGTENVAGVVGFAVALELAVSHRKSESERLTTLRDSMQETLISAFPEMVVSGNLKRRLPGHLHVSFPGIDAERLIFSLETRGVYAATGSACAANKGTRSHVLTAIGLDPSVADGSLRITLGRLSTDESIARATAIIIDTIKKEYERGGR